jgi:hypothetical protein
MLSGLKIHAFFPLRRDYFTGPGIFSFRVHWPKPAAGTWVRVERGTEE